ncbi:hypothetical protein K2173_004159 [Erythroxylum novogranatense]|uniref:Uncharacterized protein n=1 Tax=Erythroxylum novogranatense TaxID=1862640 RepID=A0AAV8SXM5_9ROSI|nr:hypothetical protein K2173_004159 [Erythroxylum novogranatense]
MGNESIYGSNVYSLVAGAASSRFTCKQGLFFVIDLLHLKHGNERYYCKLRTGTNIQDHWNRNQFQVKLKKES